MGDRKYILEEVELADMLLFFKAKAKTTVPEEAFGISSQYGLSVDIECKSGEVIRNLTAISDENGNLFVCLERVMSLEEIRKIKIDGKEVVICE